MEANTLFTDVDIIYSYTREQAIEDGVLVDVSKMATEAGFRVPVALTAAVWTKIERIPPALKGIQDVNGRLWDVLWMGWNAARRGRGSSTVIYRLHLHRNENGRRVKMIALKMVIGAHGPHDPRPCITIMLPHED